VLGFVGLAAPPASPRRGAAGSTRERAMGLRTLVRSRWRQPPGTSGGPVGGVWIRRRIEHRPEEVPDLRDDRFQGRDARELRPLQERSPLTLLRGVSRKLVAECDRDLRRQARAASIERRPDRERQFSSLEPEVRCHVEVVSQSTGGCGRPPRPMASSRTLQGIHRFPYEIRSSPSTPGARPRLPVICETTSTPRPRL
jgi:hypothetical protein